MKGSTDVAGRGAQWQPWRLPGGATGALTGRAGLGGTRAPDRGISNLGPFVRRLTLTCLLLGIPVFLALKTRSEDGSSRVGFWFLLCALGIGLVLGSSRPASQHALRAFLLFFASLAAATAVAAYVDGTQSLYSGGAAVLVCFAWCSPFLTVYGLARDGEAFRFSSKLLDALAAATRASVYAGGLSYLALGVPFGEVMDRPGELRIFGPLGDNVGFAIAVLAIRNLALGRWLAVAFDLGAIVLTATRGAMLVAVTGALILAFLRMRAEERRGAVRRRAILALAWVIVAGAVILESPLGRTALQRASDRDWLREGLQARKDVMSMGIDVVADHPFLGVGFLGFRTLEASYGFSSRLAESSDVERATYSTQNQLLQTATDTGLLGVASLLLFLGSLFRALGRGLKRARGRLRGELEGATAALLAMVIGNQSSVWILPESLSGFVFFVLAALALRWSEAAQDMPFEVALARRRASGSGATREAVRAERFASRLGCKEWR